MKAYWWGIVGTLAIGTGACDKSENVALEEFGEQSARAICGKVYECCQPMESAVVMNMGYSGGRAECGTKSSESLRFWAAVIGQEQARGRLSYDAKLARRCIDAYAAASCEAHKGNQPLDGCDSFITPKTPPGSPCGANESCIGGGCVGLAANIDGACRAFVPEGGSCAVDPCGKGLYCDGNGKLCKRRQADGQSCNLHGECQSQGCNGRDADAGVPGTCGPKGGDQTRCFVTNGCDFGGNRPRGPGALVALVLVMALLGRLRRAKGSAGGVAPRG